MSDAPRILVVEDQADLAENMVEILEGLGQSAVVACDVDAAAAIAERESLLGVLLDYRLPGRDGLAFLAEARRRGCAAPIVMVSGFASSDVTEHAKTAGALDVLPKPVTVEALRAIVRAFERRTIDVLVVEDNPDLAENVAEAVRAAGLSAEIRESCRAAIEGTERPRVALVDLRLPDASGLDVARRLAARDPLVRIVVMTAFPDDVGAELGALPNVAAPVVDKPFDLAGLVARLTATARQ